MLLTEDMRGWILICSQYHMNCYHTCLSFSLQIFSYVSLVVCLGGTLNHTVRLDCSVKFLFHAIFSSNEKILHLSSPLFGLCQPQQTKKCEVSYPNVASGHSPAFQKISHNYQVNMHYLINIYEPSSLFRLFLRL